MKKKAPNSENDDNYRGTSPTIEFSTGSSSYHVSTEGTVSANLEQSKTQFKETIDEEGTREISFESSAYQTLSRNELSFTSTTERGIAKGAKVVAAPDEIKQALKALEQKYDIKSQEFYDQWQKGEAPELEGADPLRWATLWEVWKKGEHFKRS